jgi:hypothetical protein
MIPPDDNALRAWHFKRLHWSLQALAAAGSNQRLLFPDSAPTADELAFDFDHWASVVRTTYDRELSAGQTEALQAIDRMFGTLSSDEAEFGLGLWTETALQTTDQWAEVRRLAGAALDAFGWRSDAGSEPAVEHDGTVVR